MAVTTKLARQNGLVEGRYALQRPLGAGAQGRIWFALDRSEGDAPRVIKVVAPEHVAQLRWEWDVLRRVQHPSIAHVLDLLRVTSAQPVFGLSLGAALMVSEYVPGEPIDRALNKLNAKPRLSAALSAAVVTARALSAFHRVGLVHGDVKPSNILWHADRATLIDPGLAAPPGIASVVSGTPGFMAPEAWRGERHFATDVFALGISLWRLLAPPDADDQRASSLSDPSHHIANALHAAERARAIDPSTPEAVRGVIAELVARDVHARPSAADAASRLIAAAHAARVTLLLPDMPSSVPSIDTDTMSAAEHAALVLSMPFAGHAAALTTLTQRLRTPGVTRVVGPHGSGRSRLVREAVAALQTQRVAQDQKVPSYVRVDALPERVVHDCVLHVSSASAADVTAAEALLVGAQLDGFAAHIVLELEASDARESEVTLKPLPRKAITQLVQQAFVGSVVADALVNEALTVSGGLSGRLCRWLCQLDPSTMREPASTASLAPTSAERGAVDLPGLSSARALAGLLARAGGALDVECAQAALDDIDVGGAAQALIEVGSATLQADGLLALRPDLRGHATASTKLATTTLRRALAMTTDLVRRGHLLHALGEHSAAIDAFCQALKGLRASGETRRAAAVGQDALALSVAVNTEARATLALETARALLLLGRYAEVATVLASSSSIDARLCAAEAQRRVGHLDAARAALLDVADEADGAVHAVLGRVAFDAADHAAARRHALLASEGSDWARARGYEVLAWLALRDGDAAGAVRAADRSLLEARKLGDVSELARATSVRATIALAQGDVADATTRYAQALAQAERAGDVHGAALCLLNLGLARVDRGELGPALAALRDAARRLLRIGRKSDAARGLYNLGNAAAVIGDDDMARSALKLARDAALATGGVGDAHAFSLLCEAEIAARSSRRDEARALLNELEQQSALSRDQQAAVLARAAALWCSIHDVARAQSSLARIELDSASLAGRAEAALASARIALSLRDIEAAIVAAEAGLADAERAATFELRLRAALCLAEVLETAGRAIDAARCFESARSLLDDMARGLAPSERARLREVAAYQKALRAAPAAQAHTAEGGVERWRKLAMLSTRLVGESDVAKLLDRVLDAAIELANAERGFVVMQDGAAMEVRASRGLTAAHLADASVPSRTFVTRVIQEGRPMASVDALRDQRLDSSTSVHALALRSVIAVPLRTDDRVSGAIYLDDRLRPFAFGEEELALLTRLGDVAALALDGARRLHAERRATLRLKRLRKRLRRTVDAQAVELSSLRGAHEASLSHPSIIGRGPAMRSLLSMVDRVARSELPVLITGESGTGKELVARTIHDHGPRKATVFVSENCGALADTLLESALFGHVRGAFTGADRSRIGLFEAADGGTLFLDEIGEMSAAMQMRLLRVLQDGEIRPLGTERTRKVDVRVIAATHRDLEQMVRNGSFREDLYYRLAVVSLRIPALRERPEDIAELVAHFVRRYGNAEHPTRIDRKALAMLSKHPWPGNVRQLENELRRALMLADDVVRPEHLSNALSAESSVPLNDLDLRAQTDQLERRLIRAALEQTNNNQTKAAQLLGVSRFGLQKMLKRLGL